MSLSVETLAVARKYTDDSLAGAGAVAGVPCKIQSITAITGGNRVTFLWTDNNGDDHTSAMDVMNGVDGEDGKGIQSVTVNAQDHLIITYTDGTTVDAGQIEIHSSVDSVNGQTGAVVLDAEDVGALPDNTPIPSKTSDLTNDSGFATTSDVSTALADYTTTADLTTLLAAKQDTLTFDNAPTENSNNPVKSGGVYAANQTLTSALTNNVNVNGCKNLFLVDLEKIISTNKGGTWNGNTFTQKGATYTINDNDSVTFGGTPTDYTQIVFPQNVSKADKYMLSGLSGCTNVVFGGCSMYLNDTLVSSIVINSKQNTELDLSSYTFDRITIDVKRLTNNTAMSGTAFIMLCLKSDWDLDPTYVPPTKTNLQLTQDSVTWDDYSELGAVNMLDSAIATQTVNDITVTNNGDGSYTVNCSSTEHYSANFISTKKVTLPKGTYKWTASADGKSPIGSNDCYAFIRGVNGTVDWYRSYQSSHGYGIITLTQESEIEFGLTVAANATVSNLTFKPMLTVPSYNGDYVPYAKSNKELTEDVDTINNNGFLQANSYCFYCSANSSAIDAYAQSLGITTSTTFSEVINILKNNIRYNATRFTVSTNDANLSSSASQLLKDLCGFFGITACAVLSFDVKVIDTYNQRVEIMLTDKNLNNIKIVRVTNGTAGTVKTIALS